MTTEDKIKETIEITNMTCVGCARTIENELRKFNKTECSVSFANKSFTVEFSPVDYSRNDFEKAVESHGYRIKGNTY
jgi:copper chaperone CopZ